MASDDVERIGQALLNAPLTSANNVRGLLAKLEDINAHDQNTLLTTIEALKLFFANAYAARQMTSSKQKEAPGAATSAADIHSAWLSRQHYVFQERLLQLLTSSKPALQVAALAAVMDAARTETPGSFGHVLYRSSLAAVLKLRHEEARGAYSSIASVESSSNPTSSLSGELLGVLAGKYLQFADVRYHTLLALQSIAEQHGAKSSATTSGNSSAGGSGSAEAVRPLCEVMMHMPATPPRDEFEEGIRSWCGAAESGSACAAAESHRRKKRKTSDPQDGGETVRWMSWGHQHRAYGDTWLAILKLRMPVDLYRKVLIKMPEMIIPAAPNPLLLADFLSASVDQGGLTGLLALNGLFVLVTKHGLEYPSFYSRLYSLLTIDTFQASQRVRFFQLVDVFLASPLVPAYTAAAFIKRFARLSLQAPPAGAVVCLGFIHNLLRRHPATNQLRHRAPPKPTTLLEDDVVRDDAPNCAETPVTQTVSTEGLGLDVYDPSEPDLERCRALESSLWEVAALRTHYDPEVAAFTAVLDKDLSDKRRTAEVDMQPILGRSYASRFTTEVSRRLKGVPVAYYAKPQTALFPEATATVSMPGWKFS